jgi:hypothetical protein
MHWLRIDTIKETYGLDTVPSIKKDKNKTAFKTFKAFRPDSTEELGFIRFSRDSNTVETRVYNPRLSTASLDIDYKPEETKAYLKGILGENYKLAFVSLLRLGYTIKLGASNRQWEFNIPKKGPDAEHLCCKAWVPGSRSADLWMRFGGKSTTITPVTKDDFKLWTSQCLHLRPPFRTIETTSGTILLDEAFRGKIFVASFLREQKGKLKSKFGYSFTQKAGDRLNNSWNSEYY